MTDHGVMDTKRKYRFDPPRQPTYRKALKVVGIAIGGVVVAYVVGLLLLVIVFSMAGGV